MVCGIFLVLFFYLMFLPYLGSIHNDRNSSGHHHRMHLENECSINQSEWALCFLLVSLTFQELPWAHVLWSLHTFLILPEGPANHSCWVKCYLLRAPPLLSYRVISREHGPHASYLPICTCQSCGLKQSLLSALMTPAKLRFKLSALADTPNVAYQDQMRPHLYAVAPWNQ